MEKVDDTLSGRRINEEGRRGEERREEKGGRRGGELEAEGERRREGGLCKR